MRSLIAVLACSAFTGHGHRNQEPTGVSGRLGHGRRMPVWFDGMRDGYGQREMSDSDGDGTRGNGSSSLADVRRRDRRREGSVVDVKRGGYVEPLPMTPSRSRVALDTRRATAENEYLNEFTGLGMRHVADIGAVSGGRRIRLGSTDHASGTTDSDTNLVQKASLKTWSYPSSLVHHVQVVLTTDGRPLDADVQLWQGRDNIPCKMRVYSEDGRAHPFSAMIATSDGGDRTVAIRNVGQIERPLAAYVTVKDIEPNDDSPDTSRILQGGALRTFNFDTSIENVEIMLNTDGRPLNARIELLQRPDNIKQIIELHTEDGIDRPFVAILNTMGSGSVVRVVNTAPMEFPMTASVQPHSVNKRRSIAKPAIGGVSSFS